MPRYYFHIRDDLDVPDEEGAELPSLEAAIVYAERAARSLMCETLTKYGRISLDHCIEIEHGDGTVLTTLHFADTVRILGR